MTNEMNNEVMAVAPATEVASVDALEMLRGASEGHSFLTSIADDGTRETKIKIYNAVSNTGEKIDDHKGEVLNITDFVAHPVTFVDDDGVIVEATRIVLIDDKGVGYESVANGVVSSLQKMFGIIGMPPYNPALKVIPREQKTRKGFKTLTLDLA